MRTPLIRTASVPTILRSWRPLALALSLALFVGEILAQPPTGRLTDNAAESCAIAKAADEAEEAYATGHHSPALNLALKSESALWRFIIDPATSYEDRISAAFQGAAILPAKFLPTLWQAKAEFESVPTGVNPSPCQFREPNAFYARSPDAWTGRKLVPIPGVVAYRAETRTILGVRTDLPLSAIDYPLDLQERRRTPWLYQVQRAVAVLDRGASQIFHRAERYPEMAEAALNWRPTDFYQRRVRLQNLVDGILNPSPAWVETMVRLALEDGLPGYENLELQAIITWLDVHMVPRYRDLVHAAQIVILQRAKNARVALGVAFRVAEMSRTVDSLPMQAQLRPSATSILAIATWTRNQQLEISMRCDFAVQVCKALNDPKCDAGLRPQATSSEKAESLARFDAWLAKQRLEVERRAETEMPKFTQLTSEIHQRLAPSPPGK